ncbi:hypothetical protein [Halalkalicoccus sp. NIPERK01]|uniref:hypothetical protein n=1 Tax=Halalkalicoccus sp. NIPERK01 TaxID=3053469 RepID=UPI00256F4BA6|nr:hypothetical protein [Halalkalicoccus sp. NIPERK01]MDL5361964.1 hypothetical protein [Halalkalicoccus sp. NIPERK01]
MVTIVPLSVHLLGVPFTLMVGTAASVLSVLSWAQFRESPLGRVAAAVAVVMSLSVGYHVLLLAAENLPALELLNGVLYVVLLGGIWSMVRTYRRLGMPIGAYRYPPIVTCVGVVALVAIGLANDLVTLPFVHWGHGFAALLVLGGLYRSVGPDFRPTEWPERLFRDPCRIREPADWMTPLDDSILELCYSSGLVLTPAIIGFNTEYSRAEVNRRLSRLERHDLVERVDRGKYRITPLGERYLQGRCGTLAGSS